jgi:hypothetical protein
MALRYAFYAPQSQPIKPLIAIEPARRTMMLSYLLTWLSRPAAYVWKPALMLDDPQIVSELTPALN